MGFTTRLRANMGIRADRGPLDDYWYTPLGVPSHSGTIVTPDAAMRVGAFYACVRVLAEDIGKIPLILYRRLRGGGKERAVTHPLYNVLRLQPNPRQTAFGWRETTQAHMAIRGNGYAFRVYTPGGNLQALIPLRPDRVQVESLSSERLRYRVQHADGTWKTYTQDEIFHVPGLSLDGVTGVSVVEYAREALGLAAASEAYGARFFRNNARPGGILSHPAALSADAQSRLKIAFTEAHAGPEKAWGIFVAEEGMQYQQVGMDMRDAQFIESRDFQITEIARWFRMPLHKIGYLKNATFSNIEHQSIEYVTDTLLPWLTRWEQAITLQLLGESDEYFVEFLTDALLRGDMETRYRAYQVGRQGGWLSVNEIRSRENMDPIGPEGDTRLEPLNHVPLGSQPAERPALSETRALAAGPSPVSVFAGLLADAAERIARAEVREVEKRADRAAEDPARFAAWLAEFCEGQRAYVVKTLAPLAEAWRVQTGCAVSTDTLAAHIAETGRAIPDLTPSAVMAWTSVRPSHIATILSEGFHA